MRIVFRAHLGRHADKGREKKTAVVSKDKDTGAVVAVHVQEITAAYLLEFIGTNAAPETKKFADESRAYDGLENHHTIPLR